MLYIHTTFFLPVVYHQFHGTITITITITIHTVMSIGYYYWCCIVWVGSLDFKFTIILMRVKHTTSSSSSNISMVIMIVILIIVYCAQGFCVSVVGRERTIMRGDEAQNRYT
jgi:hypothetical protein